MYSVTSKHKFWRKIFVSLTTTLLVSGQLLWADSGFETFYLLRQMPFLEREAGAGRGSAQTLQSILSAIPDKSINEWIRTNQEWSTTIEAGSGPFIRQYKIRIRGVEDKKELVISVESGDKTAAIHLTPEIDPMQHPEITAFVEKCNERYEKEYGDDYDLGDKLLWLHWIENKGVEGTGDFDAVDFMFSIAEQMCLREGRDYILLEAWLRGGLIKAIDWGFEPVDSTEKAVFAGYKETVRHARNTIADKSERAEYYARHLPGDLRLTLSKELGAVSADDGSESIQALHKFYAAVWESRGQPNKLGVACERYISSWKRLTAIYRPQAFTGEYAAFVHCEQSSYKSRLISDIAGIRGGQRLTDEQMAEVDNFMSALKSIEEAKKEFQKTSQWPKRCHIYAERVVDILKQAGVKNARFRERENPITPFPVEVYKDALNDQDGFNFFVNYHAYAVCEIAGVDVLVDISADLFEVTDISYYDGINFVRAFTDLGVVAIPIALVEATPASRRNFWFYTSGVPRTTHFEGDYETGDHFYEHIAVASNPYRQVLPIPASITATANHVMVTEPQLPRTAYWLLIRYALGNATRAEAIRQFSDLFNIDSSRTAGYINSIPRLFTSPREIREELKNAREIHEAVLRPVPAAEKRQVAVKIPRRGFIVSIAAAGAGLGISGVPDMAAAQQAPMKAVAAAARSPRAEIMQKMRAAQAAMFENNGLELTIWPRFSAVNTQYSERLLEKGYIHHLSLEADKIESEDGLKVAQAQQRVLSALKGYMLAKGDDARIKAWDDLSDAIFGNEDKKIEGYFDCEIRYWQKKVTIDKKAAEYDRYMLSIARLRQHQFDSAEDQRVENRIRLEEVQELKEIYKNLLLLGYPLPLFKIVPPVKTSFGEIVPLGSYRRGVWNAIAPPLCPKPGPLTKSCEVLEDIKHRMKKMLQREIEPQEAQVRIGRRALKIDKEIYLERGYISEEQFKRAAETQKLREQTASASTGLLAAQIQAVDDISSMEELLASPISSQRLALTDKWSVWRGQISRDLKWIKMTMDKWGVSMPKSVQDPTALWMRGPLTIFHAFGVDLQAWSLSDRLSIELIDILSEGNQVLQGLEERFKAMGFSPHIPETMEPERGLVDLQQFVPPEAAPLERPLSEEDIAKHSRAIKDLWGHFLDLRVQLKEKLAKTRTEYAEVNRKLGREDRYSDKYISIATQKQWVEEDADDELAWARIEKLEAKLLKAQKAIFESEEGTPRHAHAVRDYNGTVMSLLHARLMRAKARIKHLEGRMAATNLISRQVDRKHDECVLQELMCLSRELEAQIAWYEGLLELFRLLKVGDAALPSPDFAPNSMVTLLGLEKWIEPEARWTAFPGCAMRIGKNGERTTARLITPGKMPSGGMTYAASGNNRRGEKTRYKKQAKKDPEAKDEYRAASHIAKIFYDCAGFISGEDEHSMGIAYIETEGVHLGLDMDSGVCNVVNIEGLYTVDDREQPAFLGQCPENDSLDIIAQPTYGVRMIGGEQYLVQIGVVVRRAKKLAKDQTKYPFAPDIDPKTLKPVKTDEGFSYGVLKLENDMVDELGSGKRRMVKIRKEESAQGRPVWSAEYINVESVKPRPQTDRRKRADARPANPAMSSI